MAEDKVVKALRRAPLKRGRCGETIYLGLESSKSSVETLVRCDKTRGHKGRHRTYISASYLQGQWRPIEVLWTAMELLDTSDAKVPETLAEYEAIESRLIDGK